MCSGRVDPAFVLRAFAKGADGVLIGGCKLNECNYTTHGNFHALNMVLLVKRMMEHIGLNPERLRIAFMSGAESNVFVDTVNSHVQRVRELGPLGAGEGMDQETLKAKLEEVIKLVPYFKIVYKEKLGIRLTSPDEYGGFFTRDEIETVFREVVSYYVDPVKCQACMICARRCPEEAIAGGKGLIHVIDQEKCIKCGTCFDVCPAKFDAVVKISGMPVPAPLPVDQRAIVRPSKAK